MWIISDLHIFDNSSFIERSLIIKMLRHIQKGGKDSIIFNGDTFDFARTSTDGSVLSVLKVKSGNIGFERIKIS